MSDHQKLSHAVTGILVVHAGFTRLLRALLFSLPHAITNFYVFGRSLYTEAATSQDFYEHPYRIPDVDASKTYADTEDQSPAQPSDCTHWLFEPIGCCVPNLRRNRSVLAFVGLVRSGGTQGSLPI